MPSFRSIILVALLVGQATAFMTAGKASKVLTALESYYNRNYDSVGGYGNERYMDAGTRGYGNMDRGYNNRYGMNDYNQGGYGGGYGRYGGGMTRSRFSDWLNGSSNYIPTSADRNYVMDRGYETGGRYSNYYVNGDRYRNGFGGGGYDRFTPYNNNRYNEYNRGMEYNRGPYNDYNRGPYNNEYNRGRYNDYNRGPYNNDMNRGRYNDYNRGRNEYDRNYSPIAYNNGNRYGSYNPQYNRDYDRSFRSNEYQRTYRSPMDSHRQQYPEDQFGSTKWWDSN